MHEHFLMVSHLLWVSRAYIYLILKERACTLPAEFQAPPHPDPHPVTL